ncbi:phosphodiester glycosidase family protein [Fictibacillus barbaricus]|uniref:Exopolysaccharide biosynthesis protein n=1 Tax=Fictibacillus barbaricus TaxID=182136 RepID=A0ABU1TYV6_9BACL|nr:phosphodiester glycosidase family protein [Fictibacillus barbaricus]MDR7072392.1 exopolysaccharide biosynthesis protein [Fictibacillus barbaricus]
MTSKRIKKTSLLSLTALTFLTILPFSDGYISKTKTVEAENQQSPFRNYENKETQKLQEGVTYSRIVYGKANQNDAYMVNVDFLPTKEDAIKLRDQLTAKGYHPFVQTINGRAQDDPQQSPLGYLVRMGPYKEESNAKMISNDLISKGYSDSKTVFTGEDGESTTGPWVVHVIEMDPKTFNGKVSSALSNNQIPGKETVTNMSKTNHALAGVNGGYFVMGPKDGTEGDLAGVSMVDGKLTSEAVNGRTSLVLDKKNQASISAVSTKLSIQTADGGKREIDGLNRVPGLIRGCGGVGDQETNQPKHDFTCTDTSELIQYSSLYGTETPSGKGTEAVINGKGRITEIRGKRGGTIPKGSTVIAGTGESAEWIQQHLYDGEKITLTKKVFADNHSISSKNGMGIVNGGPRLLKDGKMDIPSTAEGLHQPDNPEFFYQFGQRRHPRTIAGIKANGSLLLVTIDGRKPGYSVGANFKESAQLLKSLGAVEAVNLDGGGSTTMTVNDKMVTTPSDTTGERPVGDAILLTQ